MKSNKLKGLRLFSAIGLVFIIILSSIAPTIAQQGEMPFSLWAMPELNEVEKYGLYPMSWYESGLLQPISTEKLNYLLEETDKKIAELGLEENANFEGLDYSEDGTREEVVTRLYNILGKYDLSGKVDIENIDSIKYFQENNIIKGYNNDLKLDEKATIEQSVVLAKRFVMHTYELLGEGSEGFLWEVKNKDNTVYLLGSIHTGDTKLYPMNKNLRDKFIDSDYLLLEANLLNPGGINEFIQISSYTDGTTLKDHVDSELYDKTVKVLEENGMPVEIYTGLKPWRIANDLAQIMSSKDQTMEQATQNAMLGIDMYFATSAMVSGKPIIELEGAAYQANLFESLSKKAQEEYLNGILDGLLNHEVKETEESDMNIWYDQWKDGNVDEFTKSYTATLEEVPDKEFTEMLIGKRDKDMANKIAELLEGEDGKTYFVVVGSAHLVVEDTVIDQLKDKGYNVNSLND